MDEQDKFENFIKVRDDKEPIHFRLNKESNDFELESGQVLDWCSGSNFTKK